jgi:hypothetical protein
MKFTFNVKGLKEAQIRIKDLQKGFDPRIFDEWANRIVNTAKKMCNDPDCKRIKLKSTENRSFRCEFADKDAVDCVIEAIQQHLNAMPLALQHFYKESISRLETKKQGFEKSETSV